MDGTFAEKFIFSTNHTWGLEECQIIFQKIKKEAPTITVSACKMTITSVFSADIALVNA